MRLSRQSVRHSSGAYAATRAALVACTIASVTPRLAAAQSTIPVAAAPRRIASDRDTVYFFPATPDEASDRTRRALGYSLATRGWFETRVRTDHAEPSKPSVPDAAAEYASSVTAVATDGEASWLGLASKKRGADAQRTGAVLYVDPSGRLQAIKRDELMDHDVSALALVGDALWVGTGRTSGTEHGTAGLLRFKRSDSTWSQYTSRNSPLPGNDIAELHAFGEQIAIVTDSGAAVLDPRTGLWERRYFDQIVRNDSLVWVASMARPQVDSVVLVSRRLATMLDDPRLSLWTSEAQSVNRDSLLALLRKEGGTAAEARRRAITTLSDVAFLPFIKRAIGSEDPAQRQLASDALVRLKDPRARDVMHAIMDTASVERALGIVGTLAAQHDELAMRWLHAKLADPHVRADTVPRSLGGNAPMSRLDTLVATIVHVGDESFVTQLLTLIDVPPARRILLGVMQLGPVAYQRQLATLVGARPRLWAPYFALFVARDSSDAAAPGAPFGEDREIRRALVTFARLALTRSDSALSADGVPTDSVRAELRTNAVAVLAEWGGTPALPFLIEQLERPQVDALALVQAIVRLAGTDGGPVFKRGDATLEQRRATQLYWNRWWETNKATFTSATRVASESALSSWRTRAGVK